VVALLGLLLSFSSAAPQLRLDYGLWFNLGELRAHWSYALDGLSLTMGSLVILVSLVTQGYSYWYLAADPALVRFQGYLQLFTAFMLQLVLADNLAVFFLGWEGVGISSYLLIGFWSTRPEARYAALKAVTVNRLGDLALLAALGLMTSISGSLDLGVNLALLPSAAGLTLFSGTLGHLTLVNGLLLLAMAAKSAQLGLHTWLADAMEGPTPVSALIHAATMVTAGIYLALRLSSLLALTPAVGALLALLGGYTALFGASVACFQWDLKKVIAYSTCSQLGYMLCLCGLGGYSLAFHHLVAHGFFKALLFLAAGVLIHSLGGEQDLRRCGGLLWRRPLTASYFGVGFAALLGLPGSSGFYSKERLLEALAGAPAGVAAGCYGLLGLALLCTSFYSCRTLSYALLGRYRGGRAFGPAAEATGTVRELPVETGLLLGGLVLLVLATEALYYPLTVALGGHYLAAAGVAAPTAPALLLGETLASPNRWLPFWAMALGVYAFGVGEVYAAELLRWGLRAPGSWPLALQRFFQRG
jgi:NADH-quinone oxidoreductase subunit L